MHDEHFEEYRDEILDGTHKVLIFVKKIKRLNEWHPDFIITDKTVLYKETGKFHALFKKKYLILRASME